MNKTQAKVVVSGGMAMTLLAMQQVVALNPERKYEHTPDEYGMKYEELIIPTPDGATLYGWYFPAPQESSEFIILSDDGEGNMADNLELISLLLSAGFNVIAYDYRGYGKSSDFEIKENVYIYPQFVKDLEAVIKFSRRKFPTTDFYLFGLGIGGSISIGLATERSDVVKVVADGPFIRLEDIKKKYKIYEGKDIIVPFGYNKQHEPYYAFEEVKSKALQEVLIIVGANDKLVGPEDVKAWLKEQKNARKYVRLHVIPDATNKETFIYDKDAYFKAVREFLSD